MSTPSLVNRPLNPVHRLREVLAVSGIARSATLDSSPLVRRPCVCSNEGIPENEWRPLERANVLTALRKAGFRISGRGGATELLELAGC